MEQLITSQVAPTAPVPAAVLQRLLELLELAARRGAFELEEYQRIGEVYLVAQQCLQSTVARP